MPTRLRKGLYRISARATPKRLNRKWARAVRLALRFATDAAILEVTVVPRLLPSTIAVAIEKGMYPCATSSIVMAVAAAELCSMMVMTAPATRKRKMLQTPCSEREPRKTRTPSLLSSSKDVSLRVASPRNNRPKPIRNSPRLAYFLTLISRKAKNISGMAMVPMLKLPAPKLKAKIQAVTVVPILAPMITAIALPRASRPALTKLTIRSVVAVELCTMAVTTMPVRMHLKWLEVILAMKIRMRFPAIFCNPPLIRDIPYRNIAREPNRVRILSSIFKKSMQR